MLTGFDGYHIRRHCDGPDCTKYRVVWACWYSWEEFDTAEAALEYLTDKADKQLRFTA